MNGDTWVVSTQGTSVGSRYAGRFGSRLAVRQRIPTPGTAACPFDLTTRHGPCDAEPETSHGSGVFSNHATVPVRRGPKPGTSVTVCLVERRYASTAPLTAYSMPAMATQPQSRPTDRVSPSSQPPCSLGSETVAPAGSLEVAGDDVRDSLAVEQLSVNVIHLRRGPFCEDQIVIGPWYSGPPRYTFPFCTAVSSLHALDAI